MTFDVEQTIRRRKSVRSYVKRPLSAYDKEILTKLMDEAAFSPPPFDGKVRMRLLEIKDGSDTEHLGTYGVIRGATAFIGVAAKNGDNAPESVGYTFEKFVLSATAEGFGTCWLAGTFNRAQFSGAMDLEEEFFPIVCPIGYPKEKTTLVNSVFRKFSDSDHRKEWSELFFEGSFGNPLTKERAGEYAFPLEMLRLAPSAANRQPWRIVFKEGIFHFYREENPKSKYTYDLQRLDVGIGACHFHLAAEDRSLLGRFERLTETGVSAPENMKYLFSWVI